MPPFLFLLLGLQSFYRIDIGGPASGESGGEKAAEYKQDRGGSDGREIVRTYSIEKTVYQFSRGKREGSAGDGAAKQHDARLAQHHPEKIGTCGTESDANTDLVLSLSHQICEQTVKSADRQEKSGAAEELEQMRGEALAAVGVFDDLIHVARVWSLRRAGLPKARRAAR